MNSLIRTFLTLGFISAGSVISTAQVNWLGSHNNDFESLASNPISSLPSNLPYLGRAGNFATFTFNRAHAEITYRVEASSDLTSWSTLATNPGTVGQSVTVSDTVLMSSTVPSRRFMRLRVTNP